VSEEEMMALILEHRKQMREEEKMRSQKKSTHQQKIDKMLKDRKKREKMKIVSLEQ